MDMDENGSRTHTGPPYPMRVLCPPESHPSPSESRPSLLNHVPCSQSRSPPSLVTSLPSPAVTAAPPLPSLVQSREPHSPAYGLLAGPEN
jgi:hypothetical protein